MQQSKISKPLNKNVVMICGTIILVSLIIGGAILYSNSKSSNIVVNGDDSKQDQPAVPVNASADDDPVLGDENAPVTIIEFSDYQCPFCRRFWSETLSQIKKEYIDTGKAKFVYRDYPLSFHPAAMPAAQGTECADEQGKFWQMHDKIFQEQDKQGQGTVQFTKEDIITWAQEIGLDKSAFSQCLNSEKYKAEVQKDLADGVAAGVKGTPATFVNGRLVSGAQPFAAFKVIIDEELKKLGK